MRRAGMDASAWKVSICAGNWCGSHKTGTGPFADMPKTNDAWPQPQISATNRALNRDIGLGSRKKFPDFSADRQIATYFAERQIGGQRRTSRGISLQLNSVADVTTPFDALKRRSVVRLASTLFWPRCAEGERPGTPFCLLAGECAREIRAHSHSS
jgi:hypothetical protein